MRIDHLDLTNFKNYSNAAIDFSPGVNLFVGSNGSGKTGLLEAINVAIGGFFGSQESKMQRLIKFDEVKITTRIIENNPARLLEPATTIVTISNDLNLSWSRQYKTNTKTNDTKGTNPISNYGKNFFAAFEKQDDRTIAPLIVYYSTQRLFKDAALSKKQQYYAAVGRRNGYLQCLKENAIKPVLDEWLGNAVTRRATKQIKEIEGVDSVLENVEKAVRETLIYFLELPAEFPLKIYQDPDFDNQLFLNYDNEHDLPLSYYSDGFRNLVYLVIDLVWRASQLNPWLNLTQISEQVTGVVTIDEIDLHLHPKWQAKAIGLIQKLFPNVQFFITTHSPTVVANFECRTKDTLFTIDDNEVNRVHDKFFGKQVDDILREILGAPDRHVPTQQKIDLLWRKIDDEAPKEEIENLLGELTELLGLADADIQRALSLIEWNKIKNESSDAIHS